jgi:hypothetical protein
MTTMAWDKKMEISMAVNAVLYELFHCSVVSEYTSIAVVCVTFIVVQTDMAGPMKDTRKKK